LGKLELVISTGPEISSETGTSMLPAAEDSDRLPPNEPGGRPEVVTETETVPGVFPPAGDTETQELPFRVPVEAAALTA
jgi:hypothetical protein